jgi:hypothetical protein
MQLADLAPLLLQRPRMRLPAAGNDGVPPTVESRRCQAHSTPLVTLLPQLLERTDELRHRFFELTPLGALEIAVFLLREWAIKRTRKRGVGCWAFGWVRGHGSNGADSLQQWNGGP